MAVCFHTGHRRIGGRWFHKPLNTADFLSSVFYAPPNVDPNDPNMWRSVGTTMIDPAWITP